MGRDAAVEVANELIDAYICETCRRHLTLDEDCNLWMHFWRSQDGVCLMRDGSRACMCSWRAAT